MTRSELESKAWNATHPDYRGHVDGARAILTLDATTGATVLSPLSLVPTARLVRVAARAAVGPVFTR